MEKIASTNRSDQLVSLFNAVGDPTRFTLVKLMAADKTICVTELAEQVGISAAGTSQHLKILESAGLLTRKRNGQKICYQLNRDNPANKKVLNLVTDKGGK